MLGRNYIFGQLGNRDRVQWVMEHLRYARLISSFDEVRPTLRTYGEALGCREAFVWMGQTTARAGTVGLEGGTSRGQ